MAIIHEIWRRITSTRYTRALEAEVTRQRAEITRERSENVLLRAQNRALLNSILGIAGVPPILVDGDAPVGVRNVMSADTAAPTPKLAQHAVPPQNHQSAAVPLRRRSWQQIYRMLEFESAKKTVPSD
jgi:hypothetical protein